MVGDGGDCGHGEGDGGVGDGGGDVLVVVLGYP